MPSAQTHERDGVADGTRSVPATGEDEGGPHTLSRPSIAPFGSFRAGAGEGRSGFVSFRAELKIGENDEFLRRDPQILHAAT
jgi:hypothetical protein